MISAAETFNGTWPFKPCFSEAAGFKQHYIDEGHGEVIICLHGEPTTFEDASHFCQEDIPHILVPLIHQFIQLTP